MISRTDIEDMTDAHVARTFSDVVATIVEGEFYKDYDQSVADLGILRDAEKRLRADLARPSQAGDERVARLVEAAKQQGAEQMRDYIAAHFAMKAALAQRALEPKPSRASVKYRLKREHADAMQCVRDIVRAMHLPAPPAAMKDGG